MRGSWGALPLFLVAACLHTAPAPVSTTINENQKPPDARALCGLLTGRFAGWRGLVPFARELVPACFGARVESGWGWFESRWGFERFAGDGSESWFFFDEHARVALADLLLPPTLSAAQVEAALGPPPWMRDVRFLETWEPALKGDADDVRCDREAVYSTRGIAFLLTRGDTALVRRIRVFAPVDERTYFRSFVGEIIWFDP